MDAGWKRRSQEARQQAASLSPSTQPRGEPILGPRERCRCAYAARVRGAQSARLERLVQTGNGRRWGACRIRVSGAWPLRLGGEGGDPAVTLHLFSPFWKGEDFGIGEDFVGEGEVGCEATPSVSWWVIRILSPGFGL